MPELYYVASCVEDRNYLYSVCMIFSIGIRARVVRCVGGVTPDADWLCTAFGAGVFCVVSCVFACVPVAFCVLVLWK